MLPKLTRRYEILRKLGAGGMGVVYEAIDRETGRHVAVKTLNRVDASALLRFKREFRALAEIEHPNLVRLHELEEQDGVWFFTMDLVDGQEFVSYVRGDAGPATPWTGPGLAPTQQGAVGHLPTVRAGLHQTESSLSGGEDLAEQPRSPISVGYDRARLTACLRQLGRALMEVHARGKVHRDIKPSNILVTKQGRVVLLDFGLVMAVGTEGEDEHLTGMGWAGTAAYMAPEAASGGGIGPASDWYSVGVILYEVLTGRLPFEGKTLEIIIKKQKQIPVSPLELDPGCDRDLADLTMALLDPDPARRPGARDILERLGDFEGARMLGEIASAGQDRRNFFIGRDRELSRFSERWQAVTEGRFASVLVTGPSGIGKTAFVKRFRAMVKEKKSPAFILSSRCYERETVPFKAFDGIVDQMTTTLVRLENEGAFFNLPVDAEHLLAMFPVLGKIKRLSGPHRIGAAGMDREESRRRAFRAFRELLESLASNQPLLLFIDDVQWIDRDSIELLDRLLSSFAGDDGGRHRRILLLMARRPPRNAVGQTEALDVLVSRGLVEEIVLGMLTRDEARQLARSLLAETGLPHAGLDDRLAEESGGNPFFLGEMVRHLQHKMETAGRDSFRGSLTLEDVIVSRIDALPDKERRLLETLAVAGGAIPHAVLAVASHVPMSDSDWWGAVSRLTSTHLMRCRGFRGRDLVEVYHDRIRETLISRMDAAKRRDTHEELAKAMEGRADLSVHVLARHWLAAGHGDKAKAYVVEAADQSMDKFAFDQASALYERAIELESESKRIVDLYRRLGDALASAGRVARAAEAYGEAAKRAEDVSVRLDARYKAADQMLKGGYVDQGLEEIRAVLSEVGYRMPKPGKAALAWTGYYRARLKMRGLSYEPASPEDISDRDRMVLDVLWSVAVGLSVGEPVLSALFHTQMMLLALDVGDEAMIAAGLAMDASLLATAGKKIQQARQLAGRAEALARKVGDQRILGRAFLSKMLVVYFAGDWVQTVEWGKRSRDHFREHCHNVGWELAMCDTFIGFALMKMGDVAALIDHVSSCYEEARRSGDRFLVANMMAMPSAWLAQGRDEELAAELEHVLDTWPKDRYQMHHWYRFFSLGELLLYQGRPKEAWEAFRAEWPAIRSSFVGHVAVIWNQICRMEGRLALAMAALSEGTDKAIYLKAARRAAKGLRRRRLAYGEAWADLIDAGRVWNETHDKNLTSEFLRRARGSLQAAHMHLDALAAAYRQAQLEGDDASVAEIAAKIRERGVLRPDRMVDVQAPGYVFELVKPSD